VFCSCTPEIYKPPQQAFSRHISRGCTAQQNLQPVNFTHEHAKEGSEQRAKKGLTPAAVTCTMPPTHHHTATFERGTPSYRRRPLGHEELATLALRKLNRQPAGVPAVLASLHSESGVILPVTSVSATGCRALYRLAANYQAGM
jgi:hypothetical protein